MNKQKAFSNEPKTFSLLSNQISTEYTWRIQELSSLRYSILANEGITQQCMIRAGVTLLYAHWEGFVKNVAELYYNFVGFQGHKIGELNNCFVGILIKNHVQNLTESKKIKILNEAVDAFFTKQNQIANFPASSPIQTANLKYEIFQDVCLLIGMDINDFNNRFRKEGFYCDFQKTLDNDLVNKRNAIAHGHFLAIKEDDYKVLHETIVGGFLYCFKEMVIDSAQSKKYLR